MHSALHRTRTPQEMETVKGGRIVLGLEINLILFYVGAAHDCMVSVHQPPYLEVAHTQGAVTIQCSFSHKGCPSTQPKSLWFRYGAEQPENLCADGCTGEAGKFTVKEALTEREVSLTVNRVTQNDSAIYICGIVFPKSKEPGAKRTGEGTILVVREMQEQHSLLIAVLSLLSIYITGALVIFVILSKSKSNSLRNKETEDSQKKKSARRIFQEIAQELYSKRHMETRQQPDKDNTFENRRALSNHERP
ncbi:immunoglobulin superfamily member 6 isoform X1 [Ailuropoda melanoleuca]|uniref:immunoglobulin superfamily member 6 isoform X1 n=1 Tax=Ailuropoda melanoleuca TaxID=9646 RepID=UPI00059B363B|nr:immunoglobulin superfamily member 6 isoform X1 [Ailuropoda melanoleuca]